jgi:hypothetical protein
MRGEWVREREWEEFEEEWEESYDPI